MKFAVIAVAVALNLAQAQPSFAVASVRPTDLSLNQQMSMKALPGGTVTATSVPLKFLITFAYDVQNIQVSGGPGWIDTDRFDIAAKTAEAKSLDAPTLRAMLRSLLADRFHLVVRQDSKDQSIYEMVQKRPGQFGPNLQPLEPGACPTQPVDRGTTPCGGFLLLDGKLTGHRVTLAALAAPLSRIVGQPVSDLTGIPTSFDITLEWTPDSRATSASPGDPPSIFTAIDEQLGLKLQHVKRAMPLLIIEHAEKPGEN